MTLTRGPCKIMMPNSRSISKNGIIGNVAGAIIRNSGNSLCAKRVVMTVVIDVATGKMPTLHPVQ